jgi:hypothetical protein
VIGVYGLSKNRYPVATRVRRLAKSFQKVAAVRWFGTEGSEVQILSPRPLFLFSFHDFRRFQLLSGRRLRHPCVGMMWEKFQNR